MCLMEPASYHGFPTYKRVNLPPTCLLETHISTMHISPLLLFPSTLWLSLATCRDLSAAHVQCSGNEGRVQFIGCYDHGEQLNIDWCRKQCKCEGQGLWCPDFTPCSGISVNATEICADPYQWSCGCASVDTGS